MPAAWARAAGHFDEAHGHYSRLLTEAEEGRLRVWAGALPLTWTEAGNAFAAVADWEGFEAFVARLKVRRFTKTLEFFDDISCVEEVIEEHKSGC